MNKANEYKKIENSIYKIGKKKYNVTLITNTPSDEALKNFANEILKTN